MDYSQPEAVLTELHYLPCIAFFVQARPFKKIMLEVHEHYPKQTYRNRCYIRTANKVQALSIPVSRPGGGKPKLKDIRVSYAEQWQNNHWRAIKSAYGKSPFFDFFADDYHDILYRKYAFLVDFNRALLSKCLELLGWHDRQLAFTDSFMETPESQYVDCRGRVDLKSAPPGDKRGGYAAYQQVFGKNFVANLSVIDLLFCEGANADMMIGRSSLRLG